MPNFKYLDKKESPFQYVIYVNHHYDMNPLYFWIAGGVVLCALMCQRYKYAQVRRENAFAVAFTLGALLIIVAFVSTLSTHHA